MFPLSAGHTAIAALRGEASTVRATLKALRKIGRGGTEIKAVSAAKLDQAGRWAKRLGLRDKGDFLASIRPLLGLTWGVPSDAGMTAVQIDPQADPTKPNTV